MSYEMHVQFTKSMQVQSALRQAFIDAVGEASENFGFSLAGEARQDPNSDLRVSFDFEGVQNASHAMGALAVAADMAARKASEAGNNGFTLQVSRPIAMMNIDPDSNLVVVDMVVT